MKLSTWLASVAVGTLVTAGGSRTAAAQGDDNGDEITDIEVPTLVLEAGGGEGGGDGGGGDIDLANIVQSAARSVTTVQEAPAIVTVITEDEIKERRHTRLPEIIDGAAPGWLAAGLEFGQFPFPASRGQVQAAQFLIDGVSMFDPFVNTTAMNESQPIELIKRIETVTGPGGVLWGSNSLLGIVNVITKDAEDVDGVEVGADLGSGMGNANYLHGYVMAGKTHLWNDDSKLLVEGSFKSWQGERKTLPIHVFSQPLPNPDSPDLYGPLTTADQQQSMMFSLFAKLTAGKMQLRVFAPFMQRYLGAGFPGVVVRKDLAQDNRPECQSTSTRDNPTDPIPGDWLVPGDVCPDKGRTSRRDEIESIDRYAVLEYRTRVAGGKAGFTAKAYLTQFVRHFHQLQILAATDGLLEGGLSFGADGTTYRPGVAIDGDVDLGSEARLLYGAEAFREFAPNNVTQSRQGDGIQSVFFAPYQVERLPLPCPLEPNPDMPGTARYIPGCPLTFAFQSDRTVFGAYLQPEWRPNKKLILNAGVRAQVAPEALSTNPYALTPTFGASAVYNLASKYHVKAQFTQGFRPPVFNNVNSNGEAVEIDGRPDLKVESTSAAQAELNGRVFKGERRIRELDFRVDYSYTRVHNLVQIVGGRYENTADRGINSAEALATLYIDGGHKIELGYTWLTVATADKGVASAIPNNWFNLLAVFNLVPGKVSASTDLRVLGAMEDPNRLVEYRNVHYCPEGDPSGCTPGEVVNELDPTAGYISTTTTGVVLDRTPPSAELMVGLTYTPTERLTFTAQAFNALNGHFYEPDLFNEYEPRLEFVSNPERMFSAYVNASYSY